MKFKFIAKERKFIFGRWYNPGDVIENATLPNSDFEELIEDKKKIKKNSVAED